MTQPVALDSAISPTGDVLCRGMEVTLCPKPGRRIGRYEITQLERAANGKIVLTVFGPLRKKGLQRHHYVNPSGIQVTHVKIKGNRSAS